MEIRADPLKNMVNKAWKIPKSKFGHLKNRISTSGFPQKYQTERTTILRRMQNLV